MSSKGKICQLSNEYCKRISNLPFQTKEGNSAIVRDTYICPLCLKLFKVNELKGTITDYLSLEDVPPKALGGHPLMLACKRCNNWSGHELDHYLQTEIDYEDNVSIRSEKGVRGILSAKGININARLKIESDQSISINIERSNNNPIKYEEFLAEVGMMGANWQKEVKAYQLTEKNRNPVRADIALLKSAYLLAFYVLGYKYILNSSLSPIRKQILNPDKDIISSYILNYGDGIPDYISDGVYAAEIRGKRLLAIIISIKMKESVIIHRYIIALPFLGVDYNIYDEIGLLKEGNNVNITLLGFAKMNDWEVKPFPQKERHYLVY